MKVLFFHATAGHRKVAAALMHAADNALRPFQRYLRQAEHTAKKRQVRYKLPWEPVRNTRVLALEPLDSRIFVRRPAPGWLIDNWPADREPDIEQPLMVVNRSVTIAITACERTAQGLRIHLRDTIHENDQVFWGGIACHLVAERAPAPPRKLRDHTGREFPVLKVEEHEDGRIVLIEGRPASGALFDDDREIDAEARPALDGLERLFDDQEQVFPVSSGLLKVDELPRGNPLRGNNGARYRWVQREGKRRQGKWLQLLPAEDAGSDDFLDPRAAFCSDEVQEVWTAATKHKATVIKVKRVDRDRYQLLVDELPPPATLLHLPLDLRNLYLQQRALNQLAEAPLPHHQALLRLCEDPRHARWPRVEPRWPTQWQVLTDDSRDGTDEQREFVARALGAEDLTLLEGPPGSGKTTAICELVLQLVAEGKRVLLCATTHVAIDNVLERLLDHEQPIEAVRIGRMDRVDRKVQDVQLDRRVERLVADWRQTTELGHHGDNELEDMAERTVVMTADLTCATTMGIVRHPLFHGQNKDLKPWQQPISTYPHWDVLIVDEASKTTIQEFMVPALMARRWIIVGDVRQLPPFADRADITANLGALVDARERELFPPDHQRARLLIWHLSRPALRQQRIRWLITEPAGVLDWIERELAQGAPEDVPDDAPEGALGASAVRIVARRQHGDTQFARVTLAEVQRGDARALHLAAAIWVLVPDDLLADISPYLPADLLATRDLERSLLAESAPWLFRHAHWLQRAPALPRSVRSSERRNQDCTTPSELEADQTAWFSRHDWAGEVAWRIIRFHELRRSHRKRERQRRRKDIERLKPRTVDIAAAIEEIHDIGLPSILEVIQDGIGEDRSHRASALTQGLREGQRSAFDQRFVSLTFQHRMHNDISVFPRDTFYGGNALRDANTISVRDAEVEWDFAPKLPARRVWLDIRGQESGGVNQREVDRMEAVLRELVRWAERKGAPNRSRPRHWEVACLCFYVKQEGAIRDMLRRLTGDDRQTRFSACHVEIVCGTVDRFQGREADLVLLSMRNSGRVGFLDSVNRLNVAVTRARQQLIILGNAKYFGHCEISELEELVRKSRVLDDRQWPARQRKSQ